MKNCVSIILLFFSALLFSQEKLITTRDVQSDVIEIIADGLDDVIIENSKSNLIEIILLDENTNTHNIFIKEKNNLFEVSFELNFEPFQNQVFRKYITRRLNRAKVVMKVPVGKHVVVYGKTVGVESKSYVGDLSIFIDKGNVNFNEVEGNINIKLFQGNIKGKVMSSNLFIQTNKGIITIDDAKYLNKFEKEFKNTSLFNFKLNSIHANVYLITQ